MKNIFKGILVFIVMLFMSSNVYAITIETDNSKNSTVDTESYYVTNKGTITIQNLAVDDTEFEAFKILDTYYNSNSNKITYEFTAQFKEYAETVAHWDGDVATYQRIGEDQENMAFLDLISGYAEYTATKPVTEKSTLTVKDRTATGSLTAGTYLILPKKSSTTNIYSVMVGNIEFSFENNEWTIKNATIVAKVSDASINLESLTGFSGSVIETLIGEEFQMQARVIVPKYPTETRVHDKSVEATVDIPQTIDFMNGLKVFGTENSTSTVEYSLVSRDGASDVFSIVKDENIIGELNLESASNRVNRLYITIYTDYVSSPYIAVRFNAKLNENAIIGQSGNNVTSSISTYSPYLGEKVTRQGRSLSVRTYGISIKTTDYAGNVLEGAKYKIYSDANLENELGDANYDSISKRSRIGIKLKDELNGLEKGTYYIKQTTAPSGYSLSDETYTVSVSPNDYSYTELIVKNVKPGQLPITGGTGTILFTFLGLFVIGGAFVYYQFKKKQRISDAI